MITVGDLVTWSVDVDKALALRDSRNYSLEIGLVVGFTTTNLGDKMCKVYWCECSNVSLANAPISSLRKVKN